MVVSAIVIAFLAFIITSTIESGVLIYIAQALCNAGGIFGVSIYFKNKMGYDIPPMTPFVGESFNVTRAGIHADGMMKDDEIYNIFNTEKILNRPAGVTVSSTSGLAGIAYWFNHHFKLDDADRVSKNDEVVVHIKEWVDAQYAAGRQTSISNSELEHLAVEYMITNNHLHKDKIK